jgi:hypothetical protein
LISLSLRQSSTTASTKNPSNSSQKKIHNEPLPDEIRSILTALGSYGELSPHRQAEIMRELAGPKRPINSNNEIAQRLVELASRLQS